MRFLCMFSFLLSQEQLHFFFYLIPEYFLFSFIQVVHKFYVFYDID